MPQLCSTELNDRLLWLSNHPLHDLAMSLTCTSSATLFFGAKSPTPQISILTVTISYYLWEKPITIAHRQTTDRLSLPLHGTYPLETHLEYDELQPIPEALHITQCSRTCTRSRSSLNGIKHIQTECSTFVYKCSNYCAYDQWDNKTFPIIYAHPQTLQPHLYFFGALTSHVNATLHTSFPLQRPVFI
jgi:hypothetical protein